MFMSGRIFLECEGVDQRSIGIKRVARASALVCLCLSLASCGEGEPEGTEAPGKPGKKNALMAVREHRAALDEKVWAAEVEAQKYEQLFVKLWDSLRQTGHAVETLQKIPFEHITLGKFASQSDSDWGIKASVFENGGKRLNHADWSRQSNC